MQTSVCVAKPLHNPVSSVVFCSMVTAHRSIKHSCMQKKEFERGVVELLRAYYGNAELIKLLEPIKPRFFTGRSQRQCIRSACHVQENLKIKFSVQCTGT